MTGPDARWAMTVEEYLRFDEGSPLKHEYVAGAVYAMSGVTLRHNTIARNIITHLDAAAGEGPCQVFFSDVRLGAAGDIYYYPDVMVACGTIADGRSGGGFGARPNRRRTHRGSDRVRRRVPARSRR